MKLLFYFVALYITVFCIHHSLYAQPVVAPFATPSSLSHSVVTNDPVKLVSFQGNLNNNKVLLYWVVDENQTADQFEVEKSFDGKNFKMAALVFGTDKPETDSYMFYEKAASKKLLYRIKIIDKKGKISYSDTIEVKPARANDANTAFLKN